jgi:DNA-binding winged helix-turn-helix (wHTH) protein/Tol biopolymer transport system component
VNPQDSADRGRSYSFLDFTLDQATQRLLRGTAEVKLRPKSFQVMRYLVENAGRLVTREELLQAVWGDVAVSDESVTKCIADIRKALGDDSQEIVRTMTRRGFLFQAQVRVVHPPPIHSRPAPHELPAVVKFPRPPAGAGAEREPAPAPPGLLARNNLKRIAIVGAAVLAVFAAGLLATRLSRPARTELTYTQLTNFPDSAVAPVLSPDGRMLAFIRGEDFFLSPDQIYVKILPNGDPVQVTHDPRAKYAPAFSPDGSLLAYTLVAGRSREQWATYSVSTLGGEPQLLLPNASGLSWIDTRHVLFSEIKSGLHMGIVTATAARAESRDVYWPAHERSMAHFSYASPDRKWALVVEMNPQWQPCRLVPLDGSSPGRMAGPKGQCTAAGWSPDGKWMYFGARVNGNDHLWRQHFPDGQPEPITSGPTEEEGVAVAPDGRSLITSIGTRQSAVWLHESNGERRISSEGFAVGRHEGFAAAPVFSPDGKSIYYLQRLESPESASILWRSDLESGRNTELLPGFAIHEFDISSDNSEVVFSTRAAEGKSQIWVAALDRSRPPRLIDSAAGPMASPHFGPQGTVLFHRSEGNANYLFRMDRDGSNRAKVVPYAIATLRNISPDRRWIVTLAPAPGDTGMAITIAVPTNGGAPRRVCGACVAKWAPDGKFFYVSVRAPSQKDRGKCVAIPVPPGETLPALPEKGIQSLADGMALSGARVVEEADITPGPDPSTFAYVKTSVHRNLFRVPLP